MSDWIILVLWISVAVWLLLGIPYAELPPSF